MRLTSLAVLLVVDVTTSDIIRRAILDCQRIDESFCCTSRVRNHCAEQCKSVQCDIIKKVESTDEEIKMEQFASGTDIGSRFSMEPIRSNPHPHDGSAQLSSSSVTTVLPPSTPIPFSMMSFTQTPFTQSPIPLTPFNGFPTLIPFQPNIDSLPDIEGSEQQSTDIPVVHSTIVKSIHHRVRTTPDPRIITPPESLVVIGEYDEETTTESYRQSTITFSTAEEVNAIVIPRTMNNTINNLNTSSNMVIIKPKESENNNQQQRTRGDSSGWTQKRFCSLTANPQRCYKRMLEMKRRKVEQLRTFDTTTASLSLPNHRSSRERLLRPSKGGWSVKILPRQKVLSRPGGIEKVPNFIVDGTASTYTKTNNDKDAGTFAKKFSNGLVGFNNQFGFTRPSDIELVSNSQKSLPAFQIFIKPLRPLPPANKSVTNRFHSTSTSPHPISTGSHVTLIKPPTQLTSSTTPQTINEQCGVAPLFKPCVTSEQASHALMECCRRKNMPPGCLSLCRYDITQAEVRSAIDRGQCGLFNVSPYLECASQGHDNTECCKHKGIIAKTGPQCEQFCRPNHGLSSLGLQHIVCGNAIGEMLQCHHSGIRA